MTMFVRSPDRATAAVNGWLWRCYHSSYAAGRQIESVAAGAANVGKVSRAIKVSPVVAVTRSITTQDDIREYKNESTTLARWLDVSIVQRKGREIRSPNLPSHVHSLSSPIDVIYYLLMPLGRAFDANSSLIDASDADTFPTLQAHGLNGTEISIPTGIPGKAKLVVFSFKHYGFSLIRSWIDPYIARYIDTTGSATVDEERKKGSDDAAVAFEICFIEYGFLSVAKSVFVNNIRNSIDQSQIDRTAIVFGGVKVRLIH